MTERTADAPAVRRARVAVSVAFFIMGLTVGMWFVHIPVVAARLSLDPATLGFALLAIGVGSLVFQPIAGVIVARMGSGRAAIGFLTGLLVLISVPIVAPSLPVLMGALFVVGATAGAFNVAINTQASEIETALGRAAMSTFHGFFSVGSLAAAGLGGFVISQGWGDGRGILAVALVLLPVGLVAGTRFLDTATRQDGGPRLALPGRAMLSLTLLAVLCTTIEFSVNDWSALFLVEARDMTPSAAAAGLAFYAFATAAMRFAGGRVAERYGDRTVVAGGGVLVAAGIAVVLLSPVGAVSAAGFLLVGVGVANLAPLLLSQASRVPGVEPGLGVASTATGLTSGILLTPPLIGFVAHAAGLPFAMALVGACGLVVAAGAATRTWYAVGNGGRSAKKASGA